jgi:hypothetical protein
VAKSGVAVFRRERVAFFEAIKCRLLDVRRGDGDERRHAVRNSCGKIVRLTSSRIGKAAPSLNMIKRHIA